MESIVIAIGGSVILSDEADEKYFNNLKKFLNEYKKNYKIFLVVGGGKTARTYIQIGRKYSLNESFLDEIGIEITRVNAKLLANILNISNKNIPKTTDDANKSDGSVIIMGGTTPGHSTDMVGAELAEKCNASKFIIATNVDGVYDKDPNRFSDAKKIDEISIKDMIKEYGTKWTSAGKNIVIDGPALEIIQRSKIPTYVLNGNKLGEIENVISNTKFNGTKIKK